MSALSTRPDPGERQRAAADPTASVWVSASAGSGKTKVLTDRVLSLLLQGVGPERILCLTFTKAAAAEMAVRINQQAAAAEMAVRINQQLSKWATAGEAELLELLQELTGKPPAEETARLARQLFARVLDVPGGLKIQTIHAFCQSLLGRFPIEAGLAPHFEVIDERSAAELMDSARDEVLRRCGADGELGLALATVSEHVNEVRFGELMGELARERHRLERFLDGRGGLDTAVLAIRTELGLSPEDTDENILARAVPDEAFDAKALREAVEVLLASGNKGDQDRGGRIADWLRLDGAGRAAGFDDYASTFLTAGGSVRATLATKPIRDEYPEVPEALAEEAARVLAIQDLRNALVTADATAALMRLGEALLQVYDESKRSLARLDYEDLILKTADLLNRPGVAPWVLFKLDGGIDHILIDEAQDTSPQQWSVVAKLADEFFAGEGARTDAIRTVFAVGDTKQSIFSFQHADPEEFRRMREHFAARVVDGGGTWRPVELDISFRSSESVLAAVDSVFANPQAGGGVVEPGAMLAHYAFREGHAGRVEVWPPVGLRETEEEETAWSAPVARQAGDDPAVRLALVLAARIDGWIGKERLEARGRPVRAGDIMVLVRTRTGFVDALVRALKDQGVPVSGLDRMVLTQQIAVMDLIALGRFLLLPTDDLTLATVLKCPLLGFDDDDLFHLAWNRGEKSLWQRLLEEAASDPRYAAARTWLAELLNRVDYVRPYELYAEILSSPTTTRENGRQRMLARLGPDAEDPIDEFLNLAFAHERGHASSLESFLHWIEAGEATVKRDLEQSGRDEVRIMTVHGSKGLQAPIVIMPDTASKPRVSPAMLWKGDMPLWPPRSEYRDSVCEQVLDGLKRRTAEEYRRLLYVAMTRAEDRLYVCSHEGKRSAPEDSWYRLIAGGLSEVAEETDFDFRKPRGQGWSGRGVVLANPQRAEPEDRSRTAAAGPGREEMEDWMLRAAPPEPTPPRPLAPSRPRDSEPPVLSPLGEDSGRRFQRGLVIHRLLEILPDLVPENRRAAAMQFLSRPVQGLDVAATAQILDEVMAVIDDPDFGPIFAPGSRAEVPIAGLVEGPDGPEAVSGQIDRLAVTAESVLIVDYKSNRPPPRRVEDVPEIYWRQMAAYRAVIGKIWPDKEIRCALLWTDGPRLMELGGLRLDRAGTRP
jgi:ATP-dependent helicase/nuclease subunit A